MSIPSRGIVLAVTDRARERLQARVLAQCWKPFGKAQQICCEQIEITADYGRTGPMSFCHHHGYSSADLPVAFMRAAGARLATLPLAAKSRSGLGSLMGSANKTIVGTRRSLAGAFLSADKVEGRKADWAPISNGPPDQPGVKTIFRRFSTIRHAKTKLSASTILNRLRRKVAARWCFISAPGWLLPTALKFPCSRDGAAEGTAKRYATIEAKDHHDAARLRGYCDLRSTNWA